MRDVPGSKMSLTLNLAISVLPLFEMMHPQSKIYLSTLRVQSVIQRCFCSQEILYKFLTSRSVEKNLVLTKVLLPEKRKNLRIFCS